MSIMDNDLIFGLTFIIALTAGSTVVLGVIFGIKWMVMG